MNSGWTYVLPMFHHSSTPTRYALQHTLFDKPPAPRGEHSAANHHHYPSRRPHFSPSCHRCSDIYPWVSGVHQANICKDPRHLYKPQPNNQSDHVSTHVHTCRVTTPARSHHISSVCLPSHSMLLCCSLINTNWVNKINIKMMDLAHHSRLAFASEANIYSIS